MLASPRPVQLRDAADEAGWRQGDDLPKLSFGHGCFFIVKLSLSLSCSFISLIRNIVSTDQYRDHRLSGAPLPLTAQHLVTRSEAWG
jgi:hypothetical protein